MNFLQFMLNYNSKKMKNKSNYGEKAKIY